MNTIQKYIEIKDIQPEMHECFFAFNLEQFAQGRKAAGIPDDKKIFHASMGLYGTDDGLRRYFADVDAIIARIPRECDPQDVYNYEFDNHECAHQHDDTEAIRLVVAYFGEDRAKTVKRRESCAHSRINALFSDDR